MRKTSETLLLISLVAVLALTVACRRDAVPDTPQAAITKPGGAGGKVSGDLMALYEEFVARTEQSQGEFRPSNSALRVVGERVVIDAVAVDDTAALARDLRAIGAGHVSVLDRTASTELPIAAIKNLEGLESLKSARAAYGQSR